MNSETAEKSSKLKTANRVQKLHSRPRSIGRGWVPIYENTSNEKSTHPNTTKAKTCYE